MERDEVYVPKTRSDLGIPKEGDGKIDYEEYLGDTPIYTLYMLLRQQFLAFPAYLCEWRGYLTRLVGLTESCQTVFNVSGQKNYPKWTNHFDRTQSRVTRRIDLACSVCMCSELRSVHQEAAQCCYHVEHWYRGHDLGRPRV